MKWITPQSRHEALQPPPTRNDGDLEGRQQILRATFPGIYHCVRELLRVRMDALAFKFQQTKDLKISDEIYRLARELGKLDEPWVFVAK